jgi:phosphoglycerate dehydrogenase-like enzyme
VDDLIRRSDIVSLHMNLTPETKSFINTERLKLFKKNAVLLNCARGELVDSAALAAALGEGQIAGYGADVLDEEPPGPITLCSSAAVRSSRRISAREPMRAWYGKPPWRHKI